MLKMQKFFITTLIIFSIIISCKKDTRLLPFDIKSLTDIENNNSMKNANDVTTQSPIIGFFNKSSSGDRDYYKVYFSLRNTSYEIIQTAVPGIDSKISFYSASGDRLFYIDNGTKGEAEKLWEYFPTSDYIIMLVESKFGHNEKVPYIIDFIPKMDKGINELEPNNNKEHSISIKLNETKKGLITPKGDVDFYKLDFDDNKVHDFSIKLENFSDIDISFVLYDEENKIEKHINNFSWGGTETFPFISNEKGQYYIKILGSKAPDERKDPIYYLTIEEEKKNPNIDEERYYERENNDNPKSATDLINSSETIGVFYPKNDEDWYNFQLLKDPISVDLSLSRIRELDPIIKIYNKNLKLVATIDNYKVDQGEKVSLDNLSKGSYFIQLSCKGKSLLIYKLFFNIRYE